jgi:hypothetical protein
MNVNEEQHQTAPFQEYTDEQPVTFEGSRIGNDDLAQILPVSDTTISGCNDLNSGNNRGTIRRRSVIELRREEDITQEQPTKN